MADQATAPPALARRGLTDARDNLGPGDRVAVPARRIVDCFFDELRSMLAAPQYLQGATTGPARTPAKPAPREQIDLPGMDSLALEAAYHRAGLQRHMPLERALSDPATRSCLELMAREMGGNR